MTPRPRIPPFDEAAAALIIEAQRAVLSEIITRIKNPRDNLSPDQLVKFAGAIAEFQKQHLLAAKLAADDQKCAARADRAAERRPRKNVDDLDAPWGRKSDGSPYTEAEFQDALQKSIAGVYGLTMPPPYPHRRRDALPSRSSPPAESIEDAPSDIHEDNMPNEPSIVEVEPPRHPPNSPQRPDAARRSDPQHSKSNPSRPASTVTDAPSG